MICAKAKRHILRMETLLTVLFQKKIIATKKSFFLGKWFGLEEKEESFFIP